MPDRNFFQRRGPIALAELAGMTGAEPGKGADGSYVIEDVAPLDQAGPKDLSFFDNVKYRDQFLSTKAGACIASPDMATLAPKGVHMLLSASPYKSYALAAQAFYPETFPVKGSVSPSAFVHPSAQIGKNTVIEEGVVIREGVKIGDFCYIESHTSLGRNVVIGNYGRVGHACTVSHALIGDHVRLFPGVRIGQDGFGFAIDPDGFIKVPQLGRVIIGDHVEIGANSCIDRGSGPDTVIGQGTWLDNMVHVGHNVKIGKGCILAGQVGIAGSTVIEDYVAMGGQVGVAGHLHIGKGARIAAKSGVTRDIPAGEEHMGYPSLPIRQFMRQIATLNRLIKREKAS